VQHLNLIFIFYPLIFFDDLSINWSLIFAALFKSKLYLPIQRQIMLYMIAVSYTSNHILITFSPPFWGLFSSGSCPYSLHVCILYRCQPSYTWTLSLRATRTSRQSSFCHLQRHYRLILSHRLVADVVLVEKFEIANKSEHMFGRKYMFWCKSVKV